MSHYIKKLLALSVLALPMAALAQTTLENTADKVLEIIQFIVPFVGGLLLIFFFVGVIGYVNAGGEEEKRTAARNTMIYSVIGMFVAFSIFGLVALLKRTFLGASDAALKSGTLPRITVPAGL